MLHSRKATTGIVDYRIDVRSVPFRFVDVGGQRQHRQKWFQCFDEVTAILFLCSSSAYDQVLVEDRVTNRLVESRNIFETIVNNRCFSSVSIILFFNKYDLLCEKVLHKNITDYITGVKFEGDPHQLKDVERFLTQLFDSVRTDRRQELYRHFTTATDTNNIKFVFRAGRDTILHRHIDGIMG